MRVASIFSMNCLPVNVSDTVVSLLFRDLLGADDLDRLFKSAQLQLIYLVEYGIGNEEHLTHLLLCAILGQDIAMHLYDGSWQELWTKLKQLVWCKECLNQGNLIFLYDNREIRIKSRELSITIAATGAHYEQLRNKCEFEQLKVFLSYHRQYDLHHCVIYN
jgi:hypothetical protein